jgi:acyl carrier protein
MTETVARDSILNTVTELAATEFGRPADELGPELDLGTVQGADSVKVLRVIAKIERIYDIELEDEQVFELKTLSDVTAAIESSLAAKGNG